MRKRKWEKRELVKTCYQWRNLPHDFPPAFTVHSFYRRSIVTDTIGNLLSVNWR